MENNNLDTISYIRIIYRINGLILKFVYFLLLQKNLICILFFFNIWMQDSGQVYSLSNILHYRVVF